MLLHYCRMAVRSLNTDRSLTALMLGGLAIGLASVMLIFLFVRHELSYDRFLPDHETLFRVDTVETMPGQSPVEIALAPGPVKAGLLKDFPQVVDATRAYRFPTTVIVSSRPASETILVADPNWFELLGIPMASGSADQALRDPGRVALSERAAMRYFGRADVIGRRLTILTPDRRDFLVGAVFQTLPRNSHLDFDVVIPFPAYFQANSEEVMKIPGSWAGAYFHTYVRLRAGDDADAVRRALPGFVDRNLPSWIRDATGTAPRELFQFRLVPARDVHFDGAALESMRPPSDRGTVLAVSAIALLVLLVASINFANLTVARSTLRSREVSLRKVVGAKRTDIFAQFLVEAICVTALAGLLALTLVELSLPMSGTLLDVPPDALYPDLWQLWLGLAALILLVALASGTYPSLVIARIRPAMSLAQNVASRTGARLRAILVVVQFAISIGLIAGTLVMVMQIRFAQKVDIGFDKEELLVVRLPEGEQGTALARTFRERLRRQPAVLGVTISSSVPADPSEDNLSVRVRDVTRPIQLGFHRVDPDFFSTYRVAALAGTTHSLRQADDPGVSQVEAVPVPAVINSAALKRLGMPGPDQAIGQVLRDGKSSYEVIGVIPDLHFRSLHAPVRDEIFLIGDAPGPVVSIRYREPQVASLLSYVETLWRDHLPDRQADITFLDDTLRAQYAKEQRQLVLMTIFSGVAILLSCLGLIAMAMFAVQRRMKEIALRKLLGARSLDIGKLLFWDFARPVLIANLVAWPLAWWILRHWLNSFAYRIDMPLAAFAAAGAIALMMMSVAVGMQIITVARTSPAHVLRRV